MNRRVITWLACVPLMLGGTELAHWLAFRVVYPDPWARSQALAATGHGYFAWLPVVAGIGVALLVSALFLQGRNASTGRTGGAVPVRLSQFAALPPLTFVLQEHLERLFHNGTLLGVVLEPTFMLGLLLQLPFAVAAYFIARVLLGVAARVGQRLAPRGFADARIASIAVCCRFSLELASPRLTALATGHAERGPPV